MGAGTGDDAGRGGRRSSRGGKLASARQIRPPDITGGGAAGGIDTDVAGLPKHGLVLQRHFCLES